MNNEEAMNVRFRGFDLILPGKYKVWEMTTTGISKFPERRIKEYDEALNVTNILNEQGMTEAINYFNSLTDIDKSVVRGNVYIFATMGPRFYEQTGEVLTEAARNQVKTNKLKNYRMQLTAKRDLASDEIQSIIEHIEIEKGIVAEKVAAKSRVR